ncbi:hypothetical protein J6590_031837 [Homalodisca vitripennis]|nr:hypothetical protein J6590_031837 [Homalodisca vitripennis]
MNYRRLRLMYEATASRCPDIYRFFDPRRSEASFRRRSWPSTARLLQSFPLFDHRRPSPRYSVDKGTSVVTAGVTSSDVTGLKLSLRVEFCSQRSGSPLSSFSGAFQTKRLPQILGVKSVTTSDSRRWTKRKMKWSESQHSH